ncbi:MAG: hypothetical protein K6G20_08965 [Ruminococcus sp.]|nr:hypothetical protein [Ruminococcus sp.]
MKKTVVILTIIVILQAALNAYFLFFDHRDYTYGGEEKWFVENSPYPETFCQITATQSQSESALALNAPTKVFISVHSKKQLANFTETINNKGKQLDSSNYSVEWYKDHVVLKLYDCDGSYHTYRFYYDD